MSYTINQPLPGDDLSVSQPFLFNNTNAANTIFGVDHYPFTDGSGKAGFHNQLTMPLIVANAHPTTPANIVEFYTMQDASNIGLLQYSRGPSDAVPTPVTTLQSVSASVTIAPTTTLDLVDLTQIKRALFTCTMKGKTGGFFTTFACGCYDNGSMAFVNLQGSNPILFQADGTKIAIRNNSVVTVTDVEWTITFNRIQNT